MTRRRSQKNKIFIKRKSSIVIFISCFIIGLALVFTLAGIYIFLNYTQDSNEQSYRNELYELNAELYAKSVFVTNASLRITDTDKIIVTGKITNKSNKDVLAIKLKASLVDQDRRVLYMERLYPLYYTFFNRNKARLSAGESIMFTHLFRRCPKYIVKEYKKSSKEFSGPKIKPDLKITELIIE